MPTEVEYYLDVIDDAWPTIMRAYNDFKEKQPVILFDVEDKKIYAYPYEDLKNEFKSTEEKTNFKEQYESAISSGKFILLVKDNKNEKLVAMTLDIE